ncbi:tyrosine-type recombinase/integrase [Streptomyces sp. NPDC096311]|uniref:tyrosine-type recombinase/integrase n=1 Tax=Streptomyces sp. NPDC096311 TaxID=3366083 RepID=UPI00381EA445
MAAARQDPDPFARLAIEILARTGMRRSEMLGVTIDAVMQIGSAYWLRVPVGKMHTDRYVPLHPQLKRLLDDWLLHRPEGLRRTPRGCTSECIRIRDVSSGTALDHGCTPGTVALQSAGAGRRRALPCVACSSAGPRFSCPGSACCRG